MAGLIGLKSDLCACAQVLSRLYSLVVRHQRGAHLTLHLGLDIGALAAQQTHFLKVLVFEICLAQHIIEVARRKADPQIKTVQRLHGSQRLVAPSMIAVIKPARSALRWPLDAPARPRDFACGFRSGG